MKLKRALLDKLMIRIIVFVVIIAVLIGGGYAWWKDAVAAVSPESTVTKTFVVTNGEGVRTIASRLKADGLIRNQVAFFLQVKRAHLDTALEAGSFRLSPSMDSASIIDALTHGVVDIWVTIPEGWRIEEIALKIAQTVSIPESELLSLSHEGFMFPDTYLIPKDASPSTIVKLFTDNFDKRVTSDIRNGIEKQGLSFEEGITLASIVEREGVSDQDRPIIAGILYNRLHKKQPLQVDATLQYALGYQSAEKSWWKKTLFNEDKEVDSPYNTYKHIGLPPAPIANPGLSSIKAVAYPEESDYFYYLHDSKGGAHYAQTLDEHNENVRKYL